MAGDDRPGRGTTDRRGAAPRDRGPGGRHGVGAESHRRRRGGHAGDHRRGGGEPTPGRRAGRSTIQYFRPHDQRGINVFETTKTPGVEFTGFKLDFGAAFTSQLQDLSHSNTAAPNVVSGVNANQLEPIGFGFNNPTANLNLNAQLAPGIRVAMTSYLSARHHNETWVKDGYIQIDQSPIDFAPLKALMEIVTVRVGDFEINYGDAHFRRSDNGNALYNPFVGNYIMDAFTTQIGGEVYLKTEQHHRDGRGDRRRTARHGARRQSSAARCSSASSAWTGRSTRTSASA